MCPGSHFSQVLATLFFPTDQGLQFFLRAAPIHNVKNVSGDFDLNVPQSSQDKQSANILTPQINTTCLS